MYPLLRCSARNLFSSLSWLWFRGYILQFRTAGASSFSLIAWSSSRFGGNHCASFLSNTLVCLRYSTSISSVVAIMVIFVRIQAFGQGMVTCPFSQSTSGLKAHSHRYPNIILSSPRLVLKKCMVCLWCPLWMVIWQYLSIHPASFVVPSMFVSWIGCSRVSVWILRHFVVQ